MCGHETVADYVTVFGRHPDSSGNTLTVDGNAQVNNTLTVGRPSSDGSLDGHVHVIGDATVGTTLTVIGTGVGTGGTSVSVENGNVSVTDAAVVGGTLTVGNSGGGIVYLGGITITGSGGTVSTGGANIDIGGGTLSGVNQINFTNGASISCTGGTLQLSGTVLGIPFTVLL